jgi:hypothetical protein
MSEQGIINGADSNQSVQVWCHICSGQSTATKNISSEYECVICRETFVEELDQGIEGFLDGNREELVPLLSAPEVPSSSSSSSSMAQQEQVSQISSTSSVTASNPTTDHSSIVNHVLERVLGINTPVATRGQPVTFISAEANGSRRPIGIVISRHSAGMERNMLSGFDSNNTGLMNLLSSLTQIRSNSPGFDSRDALSNAQFEQFLHHVLMNETSHAGAPPATDEMISKLDKLVVEGDVDVTTLGECSISQESFEYGDTIIALPCGHRFKEEPILHWLRMHRTCPVCRVDISLT